MSGGNQKTDRVARITALAAVLFGAIGAWQAFVNYRANTYTVQIEMDIKLSKSFAELMDVAHARSQSHVSEECIKQVFERTKRESRIVLPDALAGCQISSVGEVAQNAAITSIAVLGKRYPGILYPPAHTALTSMINLKYKTSEAAEALKLLGQPPSQ